jgi:transcriptional regulator with XRE-family HTH domain
MAEDSGVVDRRQAFGARLRQARLEVGMSLAESATVLGSSTNTISGFENGRKSPTLPQVEALADAYRVPVPYFWQTESVRAKTTAPAEVADIVKQRMLLRQKLIGVRLRQARLCAGKAVKEAASALKVSGRRINQYECGEQEMPLAELETLAKLYGLCLEEFMSCQEVKPAVMAVAPAAPVIAPAPVPAPAPVLVPAPVAAPAIVVRGPNLEHLRPELQAFVAQPINTLYLEVAMKLSRLSVEHLRSVAESLLEITY